MAPSRLPANETERLKALRRTRLLDTPAEQMFDAITTRAAEICGTPIAMISLIDERRQWFKSKVGVEMQETPRDIAFCAHAILNKDLMIVPDALADQRFAQNPLVTGDPKIRFYAGMPLRDRNGFALGTLCVIDRRPRQLSGEQACGLRALAESAKLLFELKTSPMAEIFARAAAATTEGVTVANASEPDMPVIFANQAFYRMTGYSEAEVLGRNCRFLQGPETDPAAIDKIRESLETKQNCIVEMVNYTKAGKAFVNRLTLVPIVDEKGRLAYVVGLQSDITREKEAEAARQKLIGMTTTMRTVNDIVFNFMNSLYLFRTQMEQCPHADSEFLRQFDAMMQDTHSKLTKINGLSSFKSKKVALGINVLDTE